MFPHCRETVRTGNMRGTNARPLRMRVCVFVMSREYPEYPLSCPISGRELRIVAL
jgi:hypothetical protein